MVPKDTSLPVQWLLAIGFYFATFVVVALALALEEEESATSEIVVLYSTPVTALDKYPWQFDPTQACKRGGFVTLLTDCGCSFFQ
jgi:hypothetical protein